MYQWFNTITGEVYVGSAWNGSARLSSYFSPSKLAQGLRIYLSLLHYGHDNFTLSVIEDLGREHMLAREQHYLDILFNGPDSERLNSSPTAGSTVGYKHTQAAKDLIAARQTGAVVSQATRDLLSSMFKGSLNPMWGKTHDPNTLLEMSALKKGKLNPMYGKPKSPEFIAQQTRDKRGPNNPQYGVVKSAATIAKLTKLVYVYDANTLVLLGSHPSSVCHKVYGMGSDTLYKYIRNGQPYKGRLYRHDPM